MAPTTFDDAVLEAIDKLYTWNYFPPLDETYGKLKAHYFNADGSLAQVEGGNLAVDEYLQALFNQAKALGELSLTGILDTVISKQHDYGHDNIAQFGEIGLVVRLADKVARISNLAGREAQNESLRDSYLDVCGYTVLFRMWRDGTFLLPLAEGPNPEYAWDPSNLPEEPRWDPSGGEDSTYAVEEYEAKLDFYGVDVGNVRVGW